MRQKFLRFGGGLAGEPRIARAHGNDAPGEGGIALFAAACTIGNGHGGWQPKRIVQNVPNHQHRGDHGEQDPDPNGNDVSIL